MTEFRVITEGLRFPEGPIAMPDGSVVLVEIERRTLTRVHRHPANLALIAVGDLDRRFDHV